MPRKKNPTAEGATGFPDIIWQAIALVGLLLSLVCVGLVIPLMQNTTGYYGRTRLELAKSCQEWKLRGHDKDGIYFIKPSAETNMYQVFCDMTTSGGGWTLVASVHENNIDGKCSIGDKWSSEEGYPKPIQQRKGDKNWRNYNAFGNIESATSADFKSPAYNTLLASDVMIWHVDNDVRINNASEEAILKYHTNDSVLLKYGGTLRHLFTNISTPVLNTNYDDLVYPRTTAGLTLISNLQRFIPDWYSYIYDKETSGNEIYDGGENMYDRGNKIYHRAGNDPFKQVTYDKSTRFSSGGYSTSSFAVHPFVFLMFIDSRSTSENFSIKIVSDVGADGRGSFYEKSDSLTFETTTLHYHSFQVYGANDVPSICGVLFYAEDKKKWNSKSAKSFVKDEWTSGTNDMIHSVIATGQPRSVIMGYVLLSRTSGKKVFSSYINDVMNKMLQDIHVADFSDFLDFGDLIYPRTYTDPSLINDLKNYVPDWYSYQYDSGTSGNEIYDGGENMYDHGNKIYHRAGKESFKQVTYDKNKSFSSRGYFTSSFADHPFVFLMFIHSRSTSGNFSIKIVSDVGADGRGSFFENSDSLTFKTSTLHYHSFQVYGANNVPSVCGVLFYAEDKMKWNSKSATSFVKDEWTSGTNDMTHSVIATGQPRSVIMGYVLLSRTSGKKVVSSYINNVMNKMLQDIHNANISDFFDFGNLIYPRTYTDPSPISHLQRFIPDWYSYQYDRGTSGNEIYDGGEDMYDSGNKIYHRAGNKSFKRVKYDKSTRFSSGGYFTSSFADHPFVFLMFIYSRSTSGNFSIKIVSDVGADGRGSFNENSDSLTFKTSTLHYHSFQVYGADDVPSVCGVLFYVEDKMKWNSKSATSFVKDEWTNGTNIMTHSVIATGQPRSVIMGYVLLSRTSGKKVFSSYINNVMNKMLQDIYNANFSGFGDLIYPRTSTDPSLINNLTNYVPDWYSYIYDRGTSGNEIADGGGDMYDHGNKIYHRAGNNPFKQVTYDKSTRFSSGGYSTSSFATHPFVFLMFIDSRSTSENFSIKIVSNVGADGGGFFSENSDSINYETSTLHYHSFQVYGAGDPSVCGVLFYAEDKMKWNSNSAISFVKDEWTSGTDDITHSVIATGQPRSVLMGYVLLSRISGKEVFSSYINNVMNKMLQDIHNANFSDIFDISDLIYPRTYTDPSSISNLQKYVPDWYNYIYDRGTSGNEINDGGENMYDSGNKIYHRAGNGSFKRVTYDKSTSFSSGGYFTSSFADHPFVFLMFIDSRSTSENFSIKIVSNVGVDGRGSFNENTDSLTFETSTLHYHSFQVYGAYGVPSICGVLFYVEDKMEWNSKSATSFVKDEWTSGTNHMTHSVIATGQPRSVIMGFVLLSRTSGKKVTSSFINNVMNKMLQDIHNTDFSAFNIFPYDRVASPILVKKGSLKSLESRLPPKLNANILHSGFIQFGARTNGYDFLALCPGFRIDIPFKAEYVCVGALSVSLDSSYCGDYTGWAGRDEDVVMLDQPNGYAHSCRDISSTLLIFTR